MQRTVRLLLVIASLYIGVKAYSQQAGMESIAHGSVPHASARMPLNSKPFSSSRDLGEVATAFQKAFLSQGYDGQGWSFDAVSGADDPLARHGRTTGKAQVTGFTVMTQIEQFDDQGRHLEGGKRWSISDTSPDGTLLDKIKKVMTGAPVGRYRIFLFSVSVDPQHHIRQDFGAKYVQWDDYWKTKTYREPMTADLAQVYIADRQLHSFFLVYEFDRSTIDGEMVVRDTGRLSPEEHLKGSGLWLALNQDAR